MSPVHPETFPFQPGVPEQIADALQARIVRGELAPGERIAEARVTAALGVSRGPVREALQQLAARHLVEIEPRRGARVTSFGLDDARGLFDVYGALVTRLAQRVAEHVDDSVLEQLTVHRQALLDAHERGDTLALLACCDQFLAAGARILANPFLERTLARLAPAFGRAHYLALDGEDEGPEQLGTFVDALIDSVSSGQVAAIEPLVSAYASEVLARLERRLVHAEPD